MIWKFELDAVEIDEPLGFDDIVFSIQRDELWHGVFIEASTSPLGFYGTSYDTLKAAKEDYGVDANVVFTASVKCEGETDYTVAITGKLNFANYQEKCGNQCVVYLSVEQNNCSLIFKNRFDQKVNIDSNIAFDKQTVLQDYSGLGREILLSTQVVPISADAEVDLTGDLFELDDPVGYGNTFISIRPLYTRVNDNSITTGYLNDPSGFYNLYAPFTGDMLSGDVTPQVLLEEAEGCVVSPWNYNVRMKGTFEQTLNNGEWYRIAFGYWDGIGNLKDNLVPIEPFVYRNVTGAGVVIAFDETFTGTVTLPDNVGVYALIQNYVLGTGVQHGRIVNFDPETSFYLANDKQCPPTTCDVYLINESLGRMTESITDRCLTVRSEYYGRTDSEPYAFNYDGCGGLRVLTTGLKIRQAIDKPFFASMKEVMFGLKGIDNIGMGMEANTVSGSGEWLRVEPAEYFYQNIKVLDIDFIPEAESEIDENLIYSNIRTGYNKWEIKSIKGIDEFCSYKERRTGIKSVNNELDISTDLVGSGYIIENLRTSTLVNTGQKDSSYDNDVFIICATRTGKYRVTFYATGNKMIFEVIGNGNEFLVSNITIAGTVNNNATRAIFGMSISVIPGHPTIIEVTFAGGSTIDEVSNTVTFPSIPNTSSIFVEQGITTGAANFYSTATAYNWRIRPLYNLMRWFKSIAQCYINLNNTGSKIFFTSGTGNYLAEGEITSPDNCKLENKVMAENYDLSAADFNNPDDSTPIYKPELVKFTYPLSIADYMALKATPYGYLNIQCGNGNYEKAFIKEVQYKPAKAEAQFTLIKKWQ